MYQRVVGHERRVRATDDHGNTAGAEAVGQGVGGRRGRGGRRDADEVGRGDVVVVDGRRLRAVDAYIVAGGLERRSDDGQTESRVEAVGQDVDAGRRGFDQSHPQCLFAHFPKTGRCADYRCRDGSFPHRSHVSSGGPRVLPLLRRKYTFEAEISRDVVRQRAFRPGVALPSPCLTRAVGWVHLESAGPGRQKGGGMRRT